MSNELTDSEKAKLVLSIIKGDITLEDVCANTSVAPDIVQNWINDVIPAVGSRRSIYEKLDKIKTQVNMFVLPGGTLACINLHEEEKALGEKSTYWCSAIQLKDLADGEVILNFSRHGCRLEEIDIAFSHRCLPLKFEGSETGLSKYSIEMELNFKYNHAKIRFARPDKIQIQNEHMRGLMFALPPPLNGRVLFSIDYTNGRIHSIEISPADQILPENYFPPHETI